MWNRYWFDSGGRYAAAIVRIALAIAVLLLLNRVRGQAPIVHPELMAASVYHPVGILMLCPVPPPAFAIELAGIVACTGALAMLVGFFTRTAIAVTTLAALVVASQAMSFQPSWSHDLNIVLIAMVAFQGARGGDALALDVLLRRAPVPVDASYQWSLRLVQLAVGLMFLSACLLKLRSGGLHWALSDNLRHQLLARYDLVGDLERPAIVDWLLAKSWRYEAAAGLNLISQIMPLFAIVFVRRPLVRGLAAVLFVVEVLALWYVMSLANPSWFPLAAVFVDWDALVRRPTPRTLPPRRALAAQLFVVAFVVFDLTISFAPRLDGVLRTFPFSRFPMFAIIRAKEPYDTHQPYELIGGRIELVSDVPIATWQQAEIDRDYVYRTLHRERDRAQLHARMVVLLAELRQRYPALGIRGVRVYITTYQAPAYPAPARLVAHDVAIFGELIGETWISHYGDAPAPGAPLALYRDGLPVAAPTTGAIPPGTDMIHVVEQLPGPDGVVRPYLLARRTNGYW